MPSQHTARELPVPFQPPVNPGALGPHLLHGMPGVMNLESVACARCDDGFEPKAKIVNSNGELFHSSCFVCAQCFRPFPDGVFYEFDGRKYCEHDFHVLFAPCCSKCGEFIIGRVIKVSANLRNQCQSHLEQPFALLGGVVEKSDETLATLSRCSV